jgi:hypothetical protein
MASARIRQRGRWKTIVPTSRSLPRSAGAEQSWGPVGERALSVNSELPGCGYLYLGWEHENERKDCMEGMSVERALDAVHGLIAERLST